MKTMFEKTLGQTAEKQKKNNALLKTKEREDYSSNMSMP